MKKKVINSLIAVAVLVGAFMVSSFIIKSKQDPPRDMSKKEVLYVKTALASSVEIETDAIYRGRVASVENVTLTPEVSGKILSGNVNLKEGQSFHAGDLLVQIYSEDAMASLQSSRSSYLQLISAVLPDIKLDFPAEFEKWNIFFNSIDLKSEMPELPEVNSEKERVFMASKNLLTQYYTIQQQEIKFRKYKLYAPFSGTYKAVNAEVGSVASMNMAIASLIRTDVMEVIVPVLPEDLDWMVVGMQVQLKRNNGTEISGKISRIATFIDPSSQMVNIYVSVKNNREKAVLEGEYVEALFTSGKHIIGMEIPREAVLNEREVYVLKEGKLAARKIDVLARFDDSFVIEGYEDGEVVVVESLVDVSVGQLAASVGE